MRELSAAVIVLVCASIASASVIGTWNSGVAVTDSATGFTGTRYTLTLTSNQGLITAIDIKVVASDYFYNEAYRGSKIFMSGPPASYDADTCFLFSTTNLVIAVSGEDDVTPPDEEWLKTSNIYAAFGFIQGVGAFESAPVLQVIVPTGADAPTIDDLYNTNDSLHNAWVVADGLKVAVTPEPATMSLLGLGALALLRRKRNGIGGRLFH